MIAEITRYRRGAQEEEIKELRLKFESQQEQNDAKTIQLQLKLDEVARRSTEAIQQLQARDAVDACLMLQALTSCATWQARGEEHAQQAQQTLRSLEEKEAAIRNERKEAELVKKMLEMRVSAPPPSTTPPPHTRMPTCPAEGGHLAWSRAQPDPRGPTLRVAHSQVRSADDDANAKAE